VNVVVTGLWRGNDLGGEAQLDISRHELTLVTRRGAVTIPYTALDGVRLRGDYAELYLDTGDVLAFDQVASLPDVVREITHQACALPEVTRSLRALGSHRVALTPEHDRFFGVFLDARRVAEEAADDEGVVAAFDASSLRTRVLRCLSEFAAERYPDDPPERRALEAELHERAESLRASFDALERAVTARRESEESDCFAAWRTWAASLGVLFERADECWLALREILVDSRRTLPRRRWRRRA